MMAFLELRQGRRNLGVYPKFCHSSAVAASCFAFLTQCCRPPKSCKEKKKRRVVLLSVEVGLLLLACLLVCLFSFFPLIALFLVSSRQLALSLSSG